MSKMWVKPAFWAAAVCLAGVVGCSSAPRGPLTVPLVYRPTDQLDVGAATGVMSKSASVVVEDRRNPGGAQVGVNTEKETPVPVSAAANTDPAGLVKEAISRALAASGVTVSDHGDRTIQVVLTRLWVDETNTYKGSAAATVRVLPAGGGAPLWEGQVTGTNERFGRSLSAENYQESLSDASLQMANKLLANEGFRAAMK
jgi:hypothetical protein